MEKEINFKIQLDENSVPEKITWEATDKPVPSTDEAKSVSIALWDHIQKNTMRIDLWSKDMPVHEMKKFYLDCIGGIGQSLLSSTGDEFMSHEVNHLCDRLVAHLEKEMKEMKKK